MCTQCPSHSDAGGPHTYRAVNLASPGRGLEQEVDDRHTLIWTVAKAARNSGKGGVQNKALGVVGAKVSPAAAKELH